jgi:class 3 adenylate cyclase/CHASE2 domain-containing sensor protein
VYLSAVKLNTLKRAPVLIAAGVIGLVCLAQIWRPELFERLERMTYDWRARQGASRSPQIATNLGFVNISDASIDAVNKGLVGRRFGLYWPRHIYGRVARELYNQGAKVVAFDVIFGELRDDHFPVAVEGQDEPMESDEYLAMQMKKTGNVVIAADQGIIPPPLFRNNALALGDITATRDFDGVLRRAKVFRTYRRWHQIFRKIEADPDYGVDLSKVRVETNQVVLLRSGDLPPIKVPLNKNGDFDLADFVGTNIPPRMSRFAKPFTTERIWHMGIVLAAEGMGLDLANANVELEKGRITFSGPNGIKRVIPVDKDGYFYINWCMQTGKNELTQEPFEGLLAQYQARLPGNTNALVQLLSQLWANKKVNWTNKLVVVGSTAVGNDLTDMGATPLSANTFLETVHWNVANSMLTGRFIRRSSLPVELLLIIAMGSAAAYVTWASRSFRYLASLCVLLGAGAYIALASFMYVKFRYWMPIVFPVFGGHIVSHVMLLAYIVVFEQKERRRMRGVFTKMVPPDVVAELEQSGTESLSLDGARRLVSVLFADIRGFTEMTDVNREKAAEFIAEHQLTGSAAEAVFDTQAREALHTVNEYLRVIAEAVLKNKGTVDKFIGDCVMAFWGAPIANPRHALCCVQAAIDAQRAVYRMNLAREEENQRREAENIKLAAAGEPLLDPLPILVIGSGINTGVVTAGYMGSDERLNYTVFGRDVNLASRLETVSGRARIIISEATLAEIIQDDPTLALSCQALDPVKVKGIRAAVPIYEVPWRENNSAVPGVELDKSTISSEDHTNYFPRVDPASS